MTAGIVYLVDSLRRFKKTPLTELAKSLDKADELRFTYDRMSPQAKKEKVGHGGYEMGHVMEASIASNKESFLKKWATALPVLIEKKEHILIRNIFDKAVKIQLGESDLRKPLRELGYELRNEEGLLPDEAEVWEAYTGSVKSLMKATLPLTSSKPTYASRKAASP